MLSLQITCPGEPHGKHAVIAGSHPAVRSISQQVSNLWRRFSKLPVDTLQNLCQPSLDPCPASKPLKCWSWTVSFYVTNSGVRRCRSESLVGTSRFQEHETGPFGQTVRCSWFPSWRCRGLLERSRSGTKVPWKRIMLWLLPELTSSDALQSKFCHSRRKSHVSDPQSQLLGIKDLMDSGTFRSSQFHDLISQSFHRRRNMSLYPQSAEAQVGSFGRAVEDFQCQRLAPRHIQPQALKLQVKLTFHPSSEAWSSLWQSARVGPPVQVSTAWSHTRWAAGVRRIWVGWSVGKHWCMPR